MSKTWNYPPQTKWTKEDCQRVILDFFKKNNRLPKNTEIRKLHMEGKSPRIGVFDKKGGIPSLAEEIGLKPNKRIYEDLSLGETRCKIISWIEEFKQKNSKPPTMVDFRKELPVSLVILRKHYKTIKNCFVVFSLCEVRNSKLVKQPFIFK